MSTEPLIDREKFQNDKVRLLAAKELHRRRRVESIRYFNPLQYQSPFVYSQAWIDAVFGGNRSGKTVSGAYKFVCLVLGEAGIERYGLPRITDSYPKPPFSCWIVSVDFTQSRDVVQPMVEQMIPQNEIKKIGYREKSAIDYIDLRSGVRILFKSCDSGWRKFQGANVPILWFDEEPDEEVFKECIIRIGNQKMKIIITMTPLMGNTWLVDALYDGTIADTAIFEFYTQDNETLPSGALENLKSVYPEDEWLTRFHGKPLQRSGLIYPEFRSNRHMYNGEFDFGEMFSDMKWFFAVDYGGGLPTAILLVGADKRGNVFVHDEHYLAGATIEDHAEAAYGLFRNNPFIMPIGREFLSDNTEYERYNRTKHRWKYSVIDPTTADGEKNSGKSVRLQFIQAFKQAGIKQNSFVLGNNDVHLGINVLKLLLKEDPNNLDPFTHEPGAPYLWISSRCRKTIWEIRRYRRHSPKNKTAESDSPRKRDDHAMDALRYICVHLAGHKGTKHTSRRKKRHPYTGY